MMIRVAIVEDELKSRKLLKNLLEDYIDDIKIVGEADNVDDAIIMIHNKHPEIVLMDIHLHNQTAMDVLDAIDIIDFKLIFITGDPDYALRGYKYNALDYVLKPFDTDNLEAAINKAIKAAKLEEQVQISALTEKLHINQSDKLTLKTIDSIHLVRINEIERLESNSSYTNVFLVTGEKIMVSKSLKDFEEYLRSYGFLRVHKSHIVNLRYLMRFFREDGGGIEMRSSVKVPVASRRRETIVNLLNQFS